MEKKSKKRNVPRKYTFDLMYDKSTAEKFINLYDRITYDEMTDKKKSIHDFDQYIDNCLENTIKDVVENEKWKSSVGTLNGVKIGDVVEITYIPASQQYVDYYDQHNFVGQIFFIDNKKDNAFLIVNDNDDKITKIKSLEREGCHYFGMIRGYYSTMKKVKKD